MENINLDFQKDALLEIIKLASNYKSGARALRSVMESTMLDLMFNLPEFSESGVYKITITKEFVTNGKDPIIRKHRKIA